MGKLNKVYEWQRGLHRFGLGFVEGLLSSGFLSSGESHLRDVCETPY